MIFLAKERHLWFHGLEVCKKVQKCIFSVISILLDAFDISNYANIA